MPPLHIVLVGNAAVTLFLGCGLAGKPTDGAAMPLACAVLASTGVAPTACGVSVSCCIGCATSASAACTVVHEQLHFSTREHNTAHTTLQEDHLLFKPRN
jgi:hypothetical protein